MNVKTNIFFLLLLCLLSSCHRVKPQAAANKVQDIDSVAIGMTLVNMRLAEDADRQCTDYIQQADTTFTLDEFGYWYTLTKRTEGREIKKDDRVSVVFQTYRLTGELIEDSEKTITVGRREVLVAIDDLLASLHEGEEARIVAPYYTAYGKDGKDGVEPLVNCIIYLQKIVVSE